MTGGVAGATDWAMDTAALVAFPTAGAAALAEGAGWGAAFLADAALAGATLAATCLAGAFGATVLVTGLGAAALAGAFAAGFAAACAGAFADDLTGDLASAFAEPLAEAGAATLAAFVALTTGDDGAAALVLGVTVFTADADARAEAPLGVGLPDFAAVGAGAFTTGLLSGDDEAGTAGGCRRVVLAQDLAALGQASRRRRCYTPLWRHLWRQGALARRCLGGLPTWAAIVATTG